MAGIAPLCLCARPLVTPDPHAKTQRVCRSQGSWILSTRGLRSVIPLLPSPASLQMLANPRPLRLVRPECSPLDGKPLRLVCTTVDGLAGVTTTCA